MARLSEKEITDLLWAKNSQTLYTLANNTREIYVGNKIHLRALIEFSNYCTQNCLYCGLRAENKNIIRYKNTFEDILLCAKQAVEVGYKTIVLQSGESDVFPLKDLVSLIEKIKLLGVDITLSLGEKSYDYYKALKNAGADRYLLRIETTNELLHKNMRPTSTLNNRKQCLENLKKLNYEVGSGLLVGLPNQTIKSIAKDLIYLADLRVDMAGIGPFIAHQDTPLAEYKQNNFDIALRTMAIMRLLLPKINIPATTAMETIQIGGKEKALKSGANVLMVNVNNKAQNYNIYPNKPLAQNLKKEKIETENFIKNIGRDISLDTGKSLTFLEKESYS